MKPDLFALQFVTSVRAESVARKQQHAIDYLLEEHRISAERSSASTRRWSRPTRC